MTAGGEGQSDQADVRAQVRIAERLDRNGRHYEAVDWLARAARSGDVEALTRLGTRLLTGQDAPLRPRDGAGLLSDAAQRGGGEAAARISVLAGGGFFGPQSWPVALDYLQRSAELGWADAREQLVLMAGEDGADERDAASWGRLRRKVDLGFWTRPPAARLVSSSPRILAVDALVPKAVCERIIAQSTPRLQRAQVHDPRTGLTIMGQTRTNRVANFDLTETSLLNLLVQTRLGAAADVTLTMMEAFAILNYQVGEEASEHFDYLDPSAPAYAAEIAQLGQRVATGLVYLNEGYEGGETEFAQLGLRHRGETGDALIFFSTDSSGTPDPRTAHAGRPPPRARSGCCPSSSATSARSGRSRPRHARHPALRRRSGRSPGSRRCATRPRASLGNRSTGSFHPRLRTSRGARHPALR